MRKNPKTVTKKKVKASAQTFLEGRFPTTKSFKETFPSSGRTRLWRENLVDSYALSWKCTTQEKESGIRFDPISVRKVSIFIPSLNLSELSLCTLYLHYNIAFTFKVISLFCIAQLILRITLRLRRWRRFTPAIWREATKAAFAVQELLIAIIITLLG